MSDIIPPDYMVNVVSLVAGACNLTDWVWNGEEKLDAKAQNYFGVLIPVTINGKIHAENVTLKLVLKLAPTDDRYRVSGAMAIMFKREIFVYSKILPLYDELQKHIEISSQFVRPKCYYSCMDYCKEIIAIQNMCYEGYKPIVHSMFLDFDHLTVSLQSLAKFHALSFMLEHKDKKAFEEVCNTCLPLSEKTNKRFLDILKDRLNKALQKFENSVYVPILTNLKENCNSFIEAMFYSSERNCLCHGDIWKENILFKCEDNKPISACLIDYQTARLSSPAFDVLYLITTSTKSDLKGEYFTSMLDIYYNTLIQFVSEAQLAIDIYSRNQFNKDLKTVGPACFIIANTALWLSCGLQQEGHVRSKQILNTESEIGRAVEDYKTIIKDIIDDFIEYGYLSMDN
ncbi:uncharacterized protein [Battus philenor]|uniref:uncharacterized protein n=1 Tax=Battus philenor TaxID=42288 RepID=UPI0035CECA21